MIIVLLLLLMMMIIVWSGCPVRQEIVDSSTAIAYGDGLEKAIEGQEAMYYVDSRGQPGDLAVHVDGLYSLLSTTTTTNTFDLCLIRIISLMNI